MRNHSYREQGNCTSLSSASSQETRSDIRRRAPLPDLWQKKKHLTLLLNMNHSEVDPRSQCPDPNPTYAASLVLICLHAIICVVATAGNLLVLLAIYKSTTLRPVVSNYFIASLAAADFLVGILVSPMYIAIVALRLWTSQHSLYVMENFIWVQSLIASTYSLSAIGVDRWIAITRVYAYKEIMTARRSVFIIVAIWLFSGAFASVSFLVRTDDEASLLWVACAVLSVGVPLALLGFCYCRIFQIIRHQRRRIAANLPSCYQTQKSRKEMLKNVKSSATIGLVVAVFFLLFVPNLVFSSVEIAAESLCQKLVIYRHWLWGITVAFFSSTVNPFIYAVRCRDYRVAIKKVLGIPTSSVLPLSAGEAEPNGRSTPL